MQNIEKYINEELFNKRLDVQFNPELLFQLNPEYRKKVEQYIIVSCSYGVESCFKYIPYLETVDVELFLTDEIINRFPINIKALSYYNLYLKTKKNKYLKSLVSLAEESSIAFKKLISLLKKLERNSDEYSYLNEEIKKISNKNWKDVDYQFILENDLSSEDVSSKDKSI